MLDSTNTIIGIVLGGFGLAGLIYAVWVKVGRPFAAMSEAMLGRPEVKDRSGAVLQDSQPGMPATVTQLAADMREVRDVTARLVRLEVDMAAVKQDVEGLKDSRLERVVAHVESATAFDAIAAVAKAQPED